MEATDVMKRVLRNIDTEPFSVDNKMPGCVDKSTKDLERTYGSSGIAGQIL